MKKTVKSVFSFALALCLVLSLGVAAFADDASKTDKDKDKEPETINIFFNLATMEPCALRMRTLEYDDIRLNGISYRADAEDGVLSIELADLAAVKLLTEYKDEAEKAGIDFDKIYIRGGKIYVKEDIGLSSDEISALKTAISAFMSSKRIGVNIGDIFELSNGDVVRFKVKVSNFIYPQQKQEKMKIQPITNENYDKLDKYVNTDKEGKIVSAKTPEITTLFFCYDAYDYYGKDTPKEDTPTVAKATAETGADGATSSPAPKKTTVGMGYVGIAKSEDDSNTYYIQVSFGEEGEKAEFKQATDLTTTKAETTTDKDGNVKEKGFWDSLFDLFKRDEAGNIQKLAKNVKVATDKDGKNVVRDITIKDSTPENLKEADKRSDEDNKSADYEKHTTPEASTPTGTSSTGGTTTSTSTAEAGNSSTGKETSGGDGTTGSEPEPSTVYVPDKTVEITEDEEVKSEIEVKNTIIADNDCVTNGHTWGTSKEDWRDDKYIYKVATCERCGAQTRSQVPINIETPSEDETTVFQSGNSKVEDKPAVASEKTVQQPSETQLQSSAGGDPVQQSNAGGVNLEQPPVDPDI